MSVLRVSPCGPNFKAPERKSGDAAGYDIHSAEDVTIPSGKHHPVATHLSVQIPKGYYGRIAPRSGLAYKYAIDVLAGVCDSDFRGEIKAILVNHGEKDFEIKAGDRIAQLVIEKIITPPVVVVESLDETERGEGGFGSTGVQ